VLLRRRRLIPFGTRSLILYCLIYASLGQLARSSGDYELTIRHPCDGKASVVSDLGSRLAGELILPRCQS